MKRLAVSVLVFLACLWPAILAGQNTGPVTNTFPLARPNVEPTDQGLSGLIRNSVSLWERTDSLQLLAYSTNSADGLDSVFFPPDSFYTFTKETLYQITVGNRGYTAHSNPTDNIAPAGGKDSTLSITMHKISKGVDSTVVLNVWRKMSNQRVVDNLGFTFNSSVKTGDKYEVALTYDRPLEFKRDATSDALLVTTTDTATVVVVELADTLVVLVSDEDTVIVRQSAKDTLVTRITAKDTVVIRVSGKDTVIVRQSSVDTLIAQLTDADTAVVHVISTRSDTVTTRPSPADTTVAYVISTRSDTITTRPSPLDTIIIRPSVQDTVIVRQSGKDTLVIQVTDKDTVIVRQSAKDTLVVQGNAAGGSLPTYSLPLVLDTVTITAAQDTSTSKSDTAYTLAFRGDRGYIAVFLDAFPVTGTGTIVGIGAQAKRRGSDSWYGGTNGSKVILVEDSTSFIDSLYVIQLSVPPADSLRVVWWSMRPAMKAVMKKLTVLFRD